VLEHTRAGDRPGSVRMKIFHAVLNEIDNDNSSFTIGDVAAAAGASRETFYGHFADRAAALDALRQIVFGEVFALCMRAYVSCEQWPRQIWQVSHILTSYLEFYPRLGRFLLLSPLRSQPKQREPGSSDCLGAFEIFLEPGAVDVEADATNLYARLTTAVVFDLLNESLSEDRRPTALLPQIGFLALAPSVGADRAVSLVKDDLSNQDRTA
jgi:AcrR family transcriptional regulator